MNKTKIEWCDSTWNPVTGCLHNCKYCYARKIANRFKPKVIDNWDDCTQPGNGLHEIRYKRSHGGPYRYGFSPTLHTHRLADPSIWKTGRNIFVCSMADLFGDWVPDKWIDEVMKACANAPQHSYLFLTKNPKRYESFCTQKLPDNIFLGATVTNNLEMYKVGFQIYDSTTSIMNDNLFDHIDLAKRFLSIEPLHEEIDKELLDNLKYFNWIIIGAETGNRKEKVVPEKEWTRSIVEKCDEYGVPVFMKDSLVPIIGEENMRREFPKELKNELDL